LPFNGEYLPKRVKLVGSQFIPVYSLYSLLKIIGRSGWWLVLFLIPFVNVITSVVVAIDLGKSFGKSVSFSVVLLRLFNSIGTCVLAFGHDKYIGPGGLNNQTPPTDSSMATV
jgi:hypothetical protein